MSPNGRCVASSIEDGVVLWDLMSKNSSLQTFRLPPFFPSLTSEISHMIFSPDGGRIIVAGDGGAANVWDVKRRRSLRIIASDVIAGAWSPHCIVLQTRRGTISTYNSSTYQRIKSYILGDGPWHYDVDMYNGNCRPQAGLLFSPDYRWMAVSYPTNWHGCIWTLWTLGEDGNLTRHRVLSDTVTAAAKIVQTSKRYHREQAAFNSDSTRLAVVSLNLQLCIWDVATATLLLSIDPPTRALPSPRSGLSISFSPDRLEHLLVMRNREDRRAEVDIEVWDASTGHLLRRLVLGDSSSGSDDAKWSWFMAPSFSPCGRYVISSFFNARGPLIWRTGDGSIVSRGY